MIFGKTIITSLASDYTEAQLCFLNEQSISAVPRGLAVRISGFHPGGPGSIPGVGTNCFFLFTLTLSNRVFIFDINPLLILLI